VRFPSPVIGLLVMAGAGYAQNVSPSKVDFGMMTWVEVKDAMARGKTTAIIYNGGTEQRGPQNVNGGHTLMGYATGIAIAEKLGTAIAVPTLPFSPNNANPELPGTIGLTTDLFKEINQQVTEQMIKNGFTAVVLMGDHGGGQKELADLAAELDAKYAPQRIRVVFCDDVYKKATDDFAKWLVANGYPNGEHADIKDASEMLYLGGDQGWVRKDQIATAVEVPGSGRRAGAVSGRGQVPAGAVGTAPAAHPAEQPQSNGIQGDARRSSAELGKKFFDMRIEYAVNQIHQLLAATPPVGKQ
jgi:creatinine amidohydrolase